jgi:hypothetical protein
MALCAEGRARFPAPYLGWNPQPAMTDRLHGKVTRHPACYLLLMLAMAKIRAYRPGPYGLTWLSIPLLLLWSLLLAAAADPTFPLLKVGDHTYTNVTVTSKARNYIFIVHAGGMVNVKVADLPPDIRTNLGYSAEISETNAAIAPTPVAIPTPTPTPKPAEPAPASQAPIATAPKQTSPLPAKSAVPPPSKPSTAPAPGTKTPMVAPNKSTGSSTTNAAPSGIMDKLSKIQTTAQQLGRTWLAKLPPRFQHLPRLTPVIKYACLGGAVLFYLFLCSCFNGICTKAGQPPGILIWVPILQFLPLLRAAAMKPIWFIAFLIPGLNLVAYVVWSFKIAKARGKGPAVALLLLLPVLNLFGLAYLGFSGAGAGAKEAAPESSGKIVLS